MFFFRFVMLSAATAQIVSFMMFDTKLYRYSARCVMYVCVCTGWGLRSRQFNEWNFADTSLVCTNACAVERMAHEKRKPSDARWVATKLSQTNGMNERTNKRTKCEHERKRWKYLKWNQSKQRGSNNCNAYFRVFGTTIIIYCVCARAETFSLNNKQLSSNSTCNNSTTTTMYEDSVVMLVSISKRWQLPLAFCFLFPLLLILRRFTKEDYQIKRAKSSQFFSFAILIAICHYRWQTAYFSVSLLNR